MNTQILGTDQKSIKKAAEIIKNGGIVAFPTETVYGLGADVFNENAVKKIFEAKGRPADNPLIVHISDFSMLDGIVSEVTESARILMNTFMPGPITIILRKNRDISDYVTAGLDTVAVRFPSDKTAQALISSSGTPIPAPSANLSGKPSPTIAKHVIDDMSGKADAIINGGECSAGVESTVVDCTGENPVILRPGIITYEDIKKIIPGVTVDKHVLKSVSADETPKSPGMKYKHYSPDADVTVIEGSPENVQKEIKKLIAESDTKVGVLSCTDHDYDNAYTLKTENGNIGYAHSLFTYLRFFDEAECKKVYAEFCIFDEYSMSVKNRLYKSAGNKIIYV